MTFGQASENCKLGKIMYIPKYELEVHCHIATNKNSDYQSYFYYMSNGQRVKHTFSNYELFSNDWRLK